MKLSSTLLKLILIVLISLVSLYVNASETMVQSGSLESSKLQLQKENIQRQLSVIKKSISSIQKEISKLDKKRHLAKDDVSKKKISQKKEKLQTELGDLYLQFESSLTGGVRVSDYDKKEQATPFDWQSEVLEIFKPMIAELKSLTELPRAIEALKSEIAEINLQIPIAKKALKQIALVKTENMDKVSAELLSRIESDWKNRLDTLLNRLQLLTFQLDEKLNPPDEQQSSVSDKLKEFFTGRGLTVIMATGAFLLFFFIFTFLGKIVEKRITREKESQPQFVRRIMRIVLQVLAVLFSLFVAMLVLYVRGDWLILGFIFFVLLGVAWGLRQSAPKYVREVKLLLNMGPVREGERVIYNGLPWRIKSLNMFSTLVNPALTGGSVRLPVDDIVDLRSRTFDDEEGWFPCNAGDYVILDDGIFGPVLRQTPEVVQMTVLGGSIKTYSTGDFLGLNPRNISHGFGVFVTFGVDYDLQSSVTQSIPETLSHALNEVVKKSPFAEYLKTLSVEFKAASASSLDLMVVTLFDGNAAGDYFAIDRFLQKSCVEICTQHQWNIPFDNMTVHLEKL